MVFTTIDWICGIIILIFAIIGLIKGFVGNIFGKLSWILALLAGYFFYQTAADLCLEGIKNEVLRKSIGFILVFVIVFLLVKIIEIIIAKIFSFSILKSLDRTLGFLFGIIEGIVIVAVIIFILTAQPFFPTGELFRNSFIFNIFNQQFDIARNIV